MVLMLPITAEKEEKTEFQLELEEIKTLSNCDITVERLSAAISRIKQCVGRLQLKFPSKLRNGILLQYMTRYIKENCNINQFSGGISSYYAAGFYALNKILSMKNITKYDLRIEHLAYAPKEFYSALRNSNVTKLYIKFDEIDEINMNLLCLSLTYLSQKSLKYLSFSCNRLSIKCMKYFAQFLSNSFDDDENISSICNCNIQNIQNISSLKTLKIRINELSIEETEILCDDGLNKLYWINVNHLDIEDTNFNSNGMKLLMNTLKNKCFHIETLSIGNNGSGAIQTFFEELNDEYFIQKLNCNEYNSIPSEQVKLQTVSSSLNKIRNLTALSIPLFIFEETPNESIKEFAQSLSHEKSEIDTLQIFLLFDHVDNTVINNAEYTQKISNSLSILFECLSKLKCLKRLYIEMMGSESNFFTKQIADSFKSFLLSSPCINELCLPFCNLIDLNNNILDIFNNKTIQCETLLSIKDHTLDYSWLDDKILLNNKSFMNEHKKMQLLKSKKYHHIMHKHCSQNIAKPLLLYLPKCVANFLTTFVGFESDPEYWLID